MPSDVPLAIFSRSMSPVDKCGTPKCLASTLACVPFPAPGGPRKITARSNCSTDLPSAVATLVFINLPPAAQPALPRKTFVIPHGQLCFQLLHGVHGHANDDQQRRAAQIKLHAQTL